LIHSPDAAHGDPLADELVRIKEEVSREVAWLKSLNLSKKKDSADLSKRKRLLYLFVRDLLDGLTGEIFSNKEARESVLTLKTARVNARTKLISWLFIFLLNMGMLLYVYLFARTQTNARQSAWFQSFVMWIFFEIFVSSTGLVVFFHLMVPLFVFTEVSKVKQKVAQDLISFKRKIFGGPGCPQLSPPPPAAVAPSFNAAKYFFLLGEWLPHFLSCRRVN
jgi:hypothetical protein